MNIDEGTMAGVDLAAATAKLAEANSAAAATDTTASAKPEQRAAQPNGEVQADPVKPSGNDSQVQPTSSDPAKAEAEKTPKPPTETAKPVETPKQPEKSKYAQEIERRDRSWKALNEEKEQFKAKQAEYEQAQAQLKREREAWEAERQQAMLENQPAPELYTKAANGKRTEADAAEKQAERAEDAGNYKEAESLRKRANRLRVEAEQYEEAGEQARKNPAPGLKELQEQRAAAEKEWTLKAGIDFPEFAKPGSAVAKNAVQFLEGLKASDPALAKHPKAVYFAAEMATYRAAAENAVKLHELVKSRDGEIAGLKAKVKELEGLTTPASGGGVVQQPAPKAFSEMSAEEQAASLRQSAAELGTFR